MTESEYLSCTDPAPLLAHVRGRLTEGQLREWCRGCCLKLFGRDDPLYGRESWPEYWTTAELSSETSAVMARRADLLRCVAGNPFRVVLPGRITRADLDAPFTPETRRIAAVFREEWRTPAVIALARGVLEGDAPAWDRMPILADALEEASCPTGIGVLEHLRNQVRCPKCLGTKVCGPDWDGEDSSYLCACGSGWLPGPEPAIHCPACWALELAGGVSHAP